MGVSASVFSGSGAGLTDIPFSALSQELFRIASGSVTASALPDRGFIVESIASGSTFSGSLFVSGGYGGVIQAMTGSWFSGSGRGLFDIPRNALTEDALLSVEIKSGSVTASVSPNFGFRVKSADSGSEFTGSVDISGSLNVTQKSQFTGSINVSGSIVVASGSYFVGDGSQLTNITLANLAIDSTKIFSGSATASISPIEGFDVNVHSRFDGSFIVSSSGRPTPDYLINRNIIVTNDGSNSYIIENGLISGSNPTLTLVRGLQYTIDVDAVGHPFWIKYIQSTGTSNSYSSSITNNGTDSGIIVFTPPSGSPNTLYYNCQLHSTMAGAINLVDYIETPAEIRLIGDTKIEGNLTASMYSGSGKGLFDIPISALSQEVFRIASGSVTASVSPVFGFRVEAFESGSDFSGSIRIDSSSFIYSEGTYLRNIPRSALTEDALISTEIKSGSVTASVAPDYGFRVITPFTSSIDENGLFTTQIASRFTGSIDISGSLFVNDNSGALYIGSSSFLYAEGTYLRNIPRSALTEDALISTEIKSGSVTASVTPDEGFRVITPFTGSQIGSQFTGSVNVSGSLIADDVTARGFFFGDGRFITNVQAAAAPLIASGSATASVASGESFVVITSKTGSQIGSEFTGSINVSGSVSAFDITSTGFFIGDGRFITNVQASAAPLIASGSATASVASGEIFQVITEASSGSYKSQFTSSVAISGSITASLYFGDGGGLFNIPPDAIEGLELAKINSGSGFAIVDPEKLLVNVPITAALYIGDGGGLFNIPANALQDLKLDRIISGSVQAVISPDKGLEIGTKTFVSGNLSVSGGLFVTGGNVTVSSGSTFIGDGSGITNINIANLSFETFILKSGSYTASISPDKGFVVNTSASIWGNVYVGNNLTATDVTASHRVFAPLVSGSLLGTYNFQGVGPTASAEYDILRFDENRGYFVPQPETTLTETVSFSNVSDLTIVHNLAKSRVCTYCCWI